MSVMYQFVFDGIESSVMAFIDGEPALATETHPNWTKIKSVLDDYSEYGYLDVTEQDLFDLFDVSKAVERNFQKVSERVSLKGNTLYFDNDPVNTALSQTIVRAANQGSEFGGLVKFLENLAQNPSEDSKDQLYSWIKASDLTITSDGMIVGYKGVGKQGDDFVSLSAGSGIVNGEEKTGQLRNNIGDVVEMPRSKVTFNPNAACSYGLHVGTYEYASGFGPYTLTVLVNPRDVVSVPYDHDAQKMRVCRYKVIEVNESKYDQAIFDWDDDEDFEDEEDLGAGPAEIEDYLRSGDVVLAKDKFYWVVRNPIAKKYYVLSDDSRTEMTFDDAVAYAIGTEIVENVPGASAFYRALGV